MPITRTARLVAVTAVSTLAVVACAQGGAQPSSTAPSPVTSGNTVAIRTGNSIAPVAVTDNAVWVPNAGDGTVSRLDPATVRVTATVRIGDPHTMGNCGPDSVHSFMFDTFLQRRCDLPSALAATDKAVWVLKNDADQLLRLDPNDAHVVARIPIGVHGFGVVADDDVVWVSDYETDSLIRVDPAANQVVSTMHSLPHGPSGMALSGHDLWVANSRADMVTRVDTTSNLVVGTVNVGQVPLAVAVGFGSVWVRGERGSTVTRIDATTNRVLSVTHVTEHVGRDGSDTMAVGSDGVWVSGLVVAKVDPKTNQVVQQLQQPALAVAVGSGHVLWLNDLTGNVARVSI